MVYAFLFSAVSVIFRILFSFRTEGRENLTAYKKSGVPFVICANHISMLDPVFIAMAWGVGRKLSIMGKAELFKNPFLAWVFTKVGVFPVDRGKGDRTVIEKAVSDVRSGRGMLIFPEGTRGDGIQMGRFKSGAFLVAGQTGADIVPVRVIYPTPNGKLKFFAPAVIKIGRPIKARQLNLESGSRRALREAKNAVENSLDELFARYVRRTGYTPPRLPAPPEEKSDAELRQSVGFAASESGAEAKDSRQEKITPSGDKTAEKEPSSGNMPAASANSDPEDFSGEVKEARDTSPKTFGEEGGI